MKATDPCRHERLASRLAGRVWECLACGISWAQPAPAVTNPAIEGEVRYAPDLVWSREEAPTKSEPK